MVDAAYEMILIRNPCTCSNSRFEAIDLTVRAEEEGGFSAMQDVHGRVEEEGLWPGGIAPNVRASASDGRGAVGSSNG
jgi:hypothetical protein